MKLRIDDGEPAEILDVSEPYDCVHGVTTSDRRRWLLFPSHKHAAELALGLMLEYVQDVPEEFHKHIGLLLDYSWANEYTNEALRAASFREFTIVIKEDPRFWWARVDGREHRYQLILEGNDEFGHDILPSGVCYWIAVEEGEG